MAQEWIDPRYADLVAAWEAAQTPERDPDAPRPVRAFITPQAPEPPRR
ncbi:hypothetical protein [Streptomyces sp. NRRL WC-3549]|nr:hypothetical protein [Streptomyces sp. NRRL WC-3549]